MLDDSEPRLPKTACCKNLVSNFHSLAAAMPQIYKLTIQNMTWYHTEYISWYIISKGIFKINLRGKNLNKKDVGKTK